MEILAKSGMPMLLVMVAASTALLAKQRTGHVSKSCKRRGRPSDRELEGKLWGRQAGLRLNQGRRRSDAVILNGPIRGPRRARVAILRVAPGT